MPDTAQPERIRDNSRLDASDQLRIWDLKDAGLNQTEIATQVGCHQTTVSRVLARPKDSRSAATRYLHLHALTLAERVVKHADVEQSLEVLDRNEVLPRKQRDSGAHSQVNIVIGMPGQPAGPDPLIALSPAPFALDAPSQGAGSD